MKKFQVLLPPPNVTGSLHIGHTLNLTIIDFLVRFNSLFSDSYSIPGQDHGGISTEIKALQSSSESKKKLDIIKDFAEDSKSKIRDQFKKLNLLTRWDLEKYTMDKDHREFVRDSFIELYNKKLIYRTKSIVNFDILLKTTISDLEVIHEKQMGVIYKVFYSVDGEDLCVFTTRPETIFADVALAVNPEDPRYKNLIGKEAIVPIVKRKIPIIPDKLVKQDFGSGVLKITPAHSLTDYEIGQKHKLQSINIIQEDGNISFSELTQKESILLKEFEGLSVKDCRTKVVNFLNLSYETCEQNIPISAKTGSQVEFITKEQWFFDVSSGAELAIKNLNKINFSPEYWRNTYVKWLENIHPWCISRQITWGHSIPAWFKEKEVFVGHQCPGEEWIPSTEVLDTWFSSALWPLSFKKSHGIYPTDVLVTAYDILFFWVARMVMMSLILDNSIPFHNVLIHRLVRDDKGRKMSKSIGNVVNPLNIINDEKYTLDSLRLAMIKTLRPNKDTRFSESDILESEKILTKIKNLHIYLEKHAKKGEENEILGNHLIFITIENSKKFYELVTNYNLHEAYSVLIDFLYIICDWFVEFSKFTVLYQSLGFAINQLLLMLYSICPNFTENKLQNKNFIITEKGFYNKKVVDLIETIKKVRSLKFWNVQNLCAKIIDFPDIFFGITKISESKAKHKIVIGINTIYFDSLDVEKLKKNKLVIENALISIDNFFQLDLSKVKEDIINEKKLKKLDFKNKLKEINEYLVINEA